MDNIINKLTAYTFALRDALERTNEANERPKIARHMAASAEMYALLHMHKTCDAIAHVVTAENRSHGLSYLSGDHGTRVAKKWLEFVDATGLEPANT